MSTNEEIDTNSKRFKQMQEDLGGAGGNRTHA